MRKCSARHGPRVSVYVRVHCEPAYFHVLCKVYEVVSKLGIWPDLHAAQVLADCVVVDIGAEGAGSDGAPALAGHCILTPS
jgi:hypothetical protein